jgi:hypothetical protein
LLVVDLFDVPGMVFAGEKMEHWSVFGPDRHFTLSNPLRSFTIESLQCEQLPATWPSMAVSCSRCAASFQRDGLTRSCGSMRYRTSSRSSTAAAARLRRHSRDLGAHQADRAANPLAS